jgi:heat shock protein HslJ
MPHHSFMVCLILASGLLLPATASYGAAQAHESPADDTKLAIGEPAPAAIVASPDAVSGDYGSLVGSWTLVALDGTMPPIQQGAPTLEVMPDGTVAGFAGINRYRAALKNGQPPGRVEFMLGPITMMAGPADIMAVEQTYLERLGASSSFTIEGDTLRLYAGDNESLTFKRSVNP